MGIGSSIGPQFVGNGTAEMRLVGALREVLAGGHLGYENRVSTLFVAAVRSCYGESCLLHGVDWMPPKERTEGANADVYEANTYLIPSQAKSFWRMMKLVLLIIHWQQLRRFNKLWARGKEAIVAGFYHEGYEEPLLMLMRRRGVHAGLVVKGEEGALSMTTRYSRTDRSVARNIELGLAASVVKGQPTTELS
ncbi:hypothetical protein HAX54_046718 [Datura stramonium]|uniref:Uncharacterized protein n=1 Tax=Datura stramonium TaxID=4076 RepID=A0ABS8WM86_DATST|nr:hypothetical protein [Datura stramonium]